MVTRIVPDGTLGRRPPLRVAVVGVGRWGKNLVRTFASLERAELVAVCDRDAGQLTDLGVTARHSTDYGAVLADASVDAVVVATPPETHTEFTLRALRAGKDVFVEKPMALSVVDARRILETSQRLRRRVMVGFVLQYHPAILELRKWVDDGTLGEISAIFAERRGCYRGHREPGPWWSLAPHDVSTIRFLMKREPSMVSAARSTHDGVTSIVGNLTFDGGGRARVSVDDGGGPRVRRLVVAGARSTAIFDDGSSLAPLQLFDPGPLDAANLRLSPSLSSTEPLRAEAAHFVNALCDDAPFRTDVEDGLSVVKVLAAGDRSASRRGKPMPASGPDEDRPGQGSTIADGEGTRS